MSAGTVKVPGVRMTLGGESWVVPPLSLGAIERNQAAIAGFTGAPTDIAQVALIADLMHEALRRNYPDLTRERVADDLIDLGNMLDVFDALMDVSGLRRRAQESGADPFPKADPVAMLLAEPEQPASPESSPPSLLQPAGPGTTSQTTSTSSG